MKKRIKYLDFVKGVAIIAVTLGHILPKFNCNALGDFMYRFCFFFELGAFFIASGVLAGKQKDYTFKQYFLKQAKNLMYPYLMFSLVITATDLISAFMQGNSLIEKFLADLAITVSFSGLGSLWFLPTLFFGSLIYYLVSKFIKNKAVVKLLVLTAIAIIMSFVYERYGQRTLIESFSVFGNLKYMLWTIFQYISKAFVAASLLCVGNIIKDIGLAERISSKKTWQRVSAAVALLVLGTVCSVMEYDFIDLHFSYIRNPILFYIGVIGITLSLMIIGDMYTFKIINYFGKNSLIIMFWQNGVFIIIRRIKGLFPKLLHISVDDLSANMQTLMAFMILIIGLVSGFIVIELITRTFLRVLIKPEFSLKKRSEKNS